MLPILAACVCAPAWSLDIAANATGLPTYGNLRSATMDNVARDLFGHRCTHYAADSPAPLATVMDWYRKNMAGAQEAPVNSDNMYGGYFKLDGIKLKQGNSFANIYRMQKQQTTSIELFKCAN